MKLKTFIIVLGLLCTFHISAQEITGLWEISKVEVGEEVMTPIGKWIRINPDSTYESGNGWLQNSTGSWQYDPETGHYLPEDKYGVKDEFGAFKVEPGAKEMYWDRMEGNMLVRVKLQRIDELPMTPADLLPGVWTLEKVFKNAEEISNSFDPQNKHYIFFRWDRIFIERTAKGKRKTGFWHLQAHQPELTMIANEEGIPLQRWNIEVNADSLKLIGTSESVKGRERHYRRIYKFPE